MLYFAVEGLSFLYPTGLLVTAETTSGRHVNGSFIRFAQRNEHHDSKQPVLVIFAEDEGRKHANYISPDDEGVCGCDRYTYCRAVEFFFLLSFEVMDRFEFFSSFFVTAANKTGLLRENRFYEVT